MVSWFFLLAIFLISVEAQTNQVDHPFYSSRLSAITAITEMSLDTDLVNYDSGQCACDVSEQCDYDCSCDSNCSNVTTTSRITSPESPSNLFVYPFCSILLAEQDSQLPTQINSIGCLVYAHSPYNGEFFDSEIPIISTTFYTHDNEHAMFSINHSITSSSVTSTIDQQFRAITSFYGPDSFGFCSIQAYFTSAINNYFSSCAVDASSKKNSLIASYTTGVTLATVLSFENAKVKVEVSSIAEVSTNQESGYTFGDTVNFSSLLIPFGGSFVSSSSLTTGSVLKRIRRSASGTVKTTTCTITTKSSYIIYYTTIDDSTSPEFQILSCTEGTQSTNRIDFVFANYADIAGVITYTDRLRQYFRQVFYPLQTILSAHQLGLSILAACLLLLTL